MADEADMAAEKEEFVRLGNLAKSRKPEGPSATGYCLNCGEPLSEGVRWCDADCQVDWDKRNVR